MNKKILEISLLAGLIIAVIFGAAADAAGRDLSDKLLRLHIIANSDSARDQELKLQVRDRVTAELYEDSKRITDIRAMKKYLLDNADRIRDVAQEVVEKNGFDYSVTVETTRMFFPTRDYETFSLPAGMYNTMRIKLGDGAGKNWWCVLFPPLCVSAAQAEFEDCAQQAGLNESEIELISSGKTVYRFKFKTIDLIEKLIYCLK